MKQLANVQGPIVLGHIALPVSGRSYCQCDHCGHKYYGNSSFGKLWPQDVVTSGEFVVIQGKQYPTSKIVTVREYWCNDCIQEQEYDYWEEMENKHPQTSRSIFDGGDNIADWFD